MSLFSENFRYTLYKPVCVCYDKIKLILRLLRSYARHMEWGEKPRESVTVMPLA